MHHIVGGSFDPGGAQPCTAGGVDYAYNFCLPAKDKLQDLTKVIREEDGNAGARQRAFYGPCGTPFIRTGGSTWKCWNASLIKTGATDIKYLTKPRSGWQEMENCRDCAHDLVVMYQRCGTSPSQLASSDSCNKGWSHVKNGKAFFRRVGTKNWPGAKTWFEAMTDNGTKPFTFPGVDGYCWRATLIKTPSFFHLNLTRWLNTI